MTDRQPQPVYRQFLEGQRVYLREVRPSDVSEAYYRWMNDGEVTQYTESRFYPNSYEKLSAYVATVNRDPNVVFFAIIEKASDTHIGNIKLGPINWIHRLGDMGLILGEKGMWGKGYATETIRLVVDYAFQKLNLHKVTAGCYANNPGSIRAFKKVGFFEEGARRRHFYLEGDYVDLVCLGILNES